MCIRDRGRTHRSRGGRLTGQRPSRPRTSSSPPVPYLSTAGDGAASDCLLSVPVVLPLRGPVGGV
eukprot:5304200-Alexandrium_andersonii.AAC.1